MEDTKTKGLLARLEDGENVICAEGYLFEFERRGYLKAGAFVPEVVIEHPELVRAMYEEFVHAGSDVVEAFTYYGHRQKLKLIGREDELEKFNRQALKMARKVADATGTLMAGNISNTTCYKPDNPEAEELCKSIFREQVQWAVEEGADFIVGETFCDFGEAKLALQTIKEVDSEMPAVITMNPSHSKTYDGMSYPEALRKLEELGADVVGLNCGRGPETILPIIKEVRNMCKGPVACLPVAYRTSFEDGLSMQDLKDKTTGKRAFPVNLDAWFVSRSAIEAFTKDLMDIGVNYLGICCGNCAHYTRTMAETLGRHPPGSKYSTDMSQHISEVDKEDNSYTLQQWQAAHKLQTA